MSKRGLSADTAPRRRGPVEPYRGTFLAFLDAAGATGASWASWRVYWKAVDALPMDPGELAVFRRHTGRETPPIRPVREAFCIAGRRSRKTWNHAARAFYRAITRDYRPLLAPGGRAVIPIIASDKRQAGEAVTYIKGLAALSAFRGYVERLLRDKVEFRTAVSVEVFTASFKAVRGFTVPELVADELAFWTSDDSASPDVEVLRALRPGMATVRDSTLLACSTPYAPRGELHRIHQRYYGADDFRVLVWVADSVSMNPELDPVVVDEAFETDAIAAASEYGRDGTVAFRSDVEDFLTEGAVDAVIGGERELGPLSGVSHVAFTDPAGGSGGDSFTVAVARREGEVATLVAVRETRPPFSPQQVVQDYAALLRSYGVREVTGDRWAGEFPREAFRDAGIEYRVSERTKSEIYRDLLPLVNSRRVALLNLPVLRSQLLTLERRVSRGGKDSIDHRPGARDDVANSVAGCMVLASEARPMTYELGDFIVTDFRRPEGSGYDPNRHGHEDFQWSARRPWRDR